ncbi:MAG: YkgJ family cysteine cluster protein [Helicobacteraceae bacterium]|nr:YkgJ family cysteine cluster protein [Candidatus Sulfurimonas ponti]MBL6973230.1 YkgJ family cysteine cluster protein [Sulfurimonas sp.]
MSTLMKEDGFDYVFNPSACEECAGRCCTGESGYIYVSKAEIEAIAKLLELDVKEFMREYLFKKMYKYSIKERKNGDSYECVFYDAATNGCSIYDARPLQCKTFPFWDYYKTRVDELKLECPGILDKEDESV